MSELGGHPLCCAGKSSRCPRRAHSRPRARAVADGARSGGAHGAAEVMEELAAHSSIPVMNMLTREHHPCQALADLLTLRERFSRLEGLKLAYVGTATTWLARCSLLGGLGGVQVAVASPPELSLPEVKRSPREQWPSPRARGVHRRVDQHGRRRGHGGREAGAAHSLRLDDRCSPGPARTRWSSTASPPTPARDRRGAPLRRPLRGLGPRRDRLHARKALWSCLLR